MDMDLCIRCGNCSLACHKMHGQSRLLRRGIQIERPVAIGKKRLQHALVPQVCMHCADPECMTGCPTGAIFRDPFGHIDIDKTTCIGCFDCATQCPYDAITMVPRAAPPPNSGFASTLKKALSFKIDPPIAPETSDDPVAIKCNLCEDTRSIRKACDERNIRVKRIARPGRSCASIRSSTSARSVRRSSLCFEIKLTPSVNIHKSDPLARAWHIGGA